MISGKSGNRLASHNPECAFSIFTGSQTGNMPRVPEPGSVRGEHGADTVQELPEDHDAGVARKGSLKMKMTKYQMDTFTISN